MPSVAVRDPVGGCRGGGARRAGAPGAASGRAGGSGGRLGLAVGWGTAVSGLSGLGDLGGLAFGACVEAGRAAVLGAGGRSLRCGRRCGGAASRRRFSSGGGAAAISVAAGGLAVRGAEPARTRRRRGSRVWAPGLSLRVGRSLIEP